MSSGEAAVITTGIFFSAVDWSVNFKDAPVYKRSQRTINLHVANSIKKYMYGTYLYSITYLLTFQSYYEGESLPLLT